MSPLSPEVKHARKQAINEAISLLQKEGQPVTAHRVAKRIHSRKLIPGLTFKAIEQHCRKYFSSHVLNSKKRQEHTQASDHAADPAHEETNVPIDITHPRIAEMKAALAVIRVLLPIEPLHAHEETLHRFRRQINAAFAVITSHHVLCEPEKHLLDSITDSTETPSVSYLNDVLRIQNLIAAIEHNLQEMEQDLNPIDFAEPFEVVDEHDSTAAYHALIEKCKNDPHLMPSRLASGIQELLKKHEVKLNGDREHYQNRARRLFWELRPVDNILAAIEKEIKNKPGAQVK